MRLAPHRFGRMDPVRPDYGGDAITSLIPALVGGRPALVHDGSDDLISAAGS